MSDIRIPVEAVAAVMWFIGSRELRIHWYPNEDGLPSIEGAKRSIEIVDGFLAGWLAARNHASLPEVLAGHVAGWLKGNEKQSEQVRHELFPLGMVQCWIDRAESAEKELKERRREDAARQSYAGL